MRADPEHRRGQSGISESTVPDGGAQNARNERRRTLVLPGRELAKRRAYTASMRFLLSVALIVSATALLCHGLFKDEEARAALTSAGTSESALRQVERTWPYSFAAVDARRSQLDAWTKDGRTPTDASFFALASSRVQIGIRDELPFVDPYAAAAIGLLGLILAVILPGTRFRGAALMLLLVGLCVSALSFMEPGQQVKWIGTARFLSYPVAHLPHVAVGLLFFAGLVLGPKVSHKEG